MLFHIKTIPTIQAVLFDMDGLLVDSERIAQHCCIQAGLDLGLPMDETIARRFLGVTHEGCVRILKETFPSVDPEQFFEYSRTHLQVLFERQLTAKPGAKELLAYLKTRSVPYALASSSGRDRIEKSLRLTDLSDDFPLQIRMTGEKAARSKPAPDLFLAAASCLSVSPEYCLVLEDSENGIKAGRAAGCVVCMVPDLIPYSERLKPWCDLVAQDLFDVLFFLRSIFSE